MFQNYEHLPRAKATKPGEMASDRGGADYREPNTAPIAECRLQTKGVSDKGRG